MKWGRDPSYGEITSAELPLALQEKISRYDVLKSYTDMILGIGIDLDLYMENETYRNIVNQNFDEITVGYHMKHGAMVNSNGQLNFTKVDGLINKLKEANLSVFGHTLVWHQNQNASYLNSLIAPQIIPSPGESQLDVSALLDGSFTGWSRNNAGGITVVQGAGLNNGPAVRFETTTAGNEWDTQLASPEIPAVVGHAYEISFWIRSEAPGQGRMSFAGMINNYPWVNGGALFNTSASWTQITYNEVWSSSENANVPFTAVANAIKIAFDMGKVTGVYYVDINSISVIDLDAAPVEVNYVNNGGFETGDLTGWSALNTGAGIEISNSEKFSGSYSVKLTSSSTAKNAWDLQLESDQIALDASKTYTFSFYIKSNVAGKGRVSFPGGVDGNQYPWMNWTGSGASEAFTTVAGAWTLISVELTNTSNVKLSFDMGYLPDVTYYIDDIKVIEKTLTRSSITFRSGPIIVDKTDEEKAQIIGEAMENWISQMVGHYKNDVHAWDVVNEPMNDAGQLRSGKNVTELAADEFYWQDYLGKDYAVTAFKLARQYGSPTDKLFINDYGLENSLAKCDGLIEYVTYIESKGAQVDGIGTQMHLSLSSDTTKIAQMFQKLAATGKLIKVSEMDIQIGTASPTIEQYAQQAALYKYVADMYMKYIPAEQRYGITVWSVSDNADEHVNWLPNDAPCLWDKDYQRKHAYKGFADGLAGRDVSADFTGELEY
ncbi:MAG TPA: endo-1,4-beta-xylanase [Dysgonamonadaceae bacterium]|nr:endo-1,4-beta-xylanase [Dysgonamonadaceae bacterium]